MSRRRRLGSIAHRPSGPALPTSPRWPPLPTSLARRTGVPAKARDALRAERAERVAQDMAAQRARVLGGLE